MKALSVKSEMNKVLSMDLGSAMAIQMETRDAVRPKADRIASPTIMAERFGNQQAQAKSVKIRNLLSNTGEATATTDTTDVTATSTAQMSIRTFAKLSKQ